MSEKPKTVDEIMRLAVNTERAFERWMNRPTREASSTQTEYYKHAEALRAAISALIADRDRLQALRDEETALLDSCGTILCRNQVDHERFDGCLYCDRDRIKSVLQEERSLYEHSMRERDELAADLERATKERAEAVKECVELRRVNGNALKAITDMLPDTASPYTPGIAERIVRLPEVEADRDRLAQRCERLQKAINEHWWYATEDGEFGCIHCAKLVEHPEDWNGRDAPVGFPHTETCIVGEGPIVE